MTWGLRFKERMAGWISFDHLELSAKIPLNTRFPFEINLHVFSPAVFRFSVPRQIRGYALMPGAPVASASSDRLNSPRVQGTMTTTVGGVAYDFSVDFPELGKIEIKGAKKYAYGSFSLRRLLSSMTVLPFEAVLNGIQVGEGELVYRNPLWQFPLTMRLANARYGFDDTAQLSERLASLVPIFVAQPDRFITHAELIERIRLQLTTFSYLSKKICSFSASLIAALAIFRFRKTPSALHESEREIFAQLLSKTKYLRELTLPVSVPVLSVVYSSKAFLETKSQHIPVPAIQAEEERWMRLNISPTASETSQEIEVDVVVVGSGAGGGAAAYELASQGHAVAIVEAGHYYKRPDFLGSRIEMMNRLFRDAGQTFPVSNALVWTPTGRCVGGTTTINSGTCFRTPDSIVEQWRRQLGLRGIDLSPYFGDVERMLDVRPVPTELQGPLRNLLKKGLEGTPYKLEPLMRAESGCDGQSFCILGCPAGAKRSTDVSYIPEAMKKNAHLFSHYNVEEILFNGARAIGVRARLEGYGREFSVTIKARAVVLAGGTMNTPFLLWKAGLHRELCQLGKNLSMHPAITVGALFGEVVRQKLFVPQSLGVLGTNDENFVLEGYTLAIDSIPIAMSVYGKELDDLMMNADRFTNFSAMIKDASTGRLIFSRNRGATPLYYFNQEMVRRMKRSTSLLADIFFKSGATAVFTPMRGLEKVTERSQLQKMRDARMSAFDFRSIAAFHPLGTCRMGGHPSMSVVSENGAVWGRKGLYVVDGSAIPGPLGVNPQVTIMANSLRIARALGQAL